MNISRFNIEGVAKTAKFYEILPGRQRTYYSFISILHEKLARVSPVAAGTLFMPLTGTSPSYDDHSRFGIYVEHLPSGTSLRCLEHYKQLISKDKKDPDFTKFDYGVDLNLEKYQQSNPPKYDFDLLKIPIRSIVGKDDPLSDIEDNRILHDQLKALGKNVDLKVVDNCGHMTYSWGKEVDWMLDFVDFNLKNH